MEQGFCLWRRLFFSARSAIWLYIIGHGRTPERITHPLYWAEFALLAAIFVVENSDIKREKQGRKIAAAVIFAAVSAVFFHKEYTTLDQRYTSLSEKAHTYETVHNYCNENSDNFYFTPIFSLAIYPEMVFDGNSEPDNFDYLGGWLVKSPAHREKLNNNGMKTVEDGLTNNDNVYVVQHSDYIAFETEYPFEWLINYYSHKGKTVAVIKTDVVIDNIEVYQVRQIK